VAEEEAVDEKEEVEEEPAMDDLDLFIDLGGDLGAFDNETAEADNDTDVWNSSSSSSSSTSINEDMTDDDILYTPLFLTVVVDNGTAADNNDIELYDDFLVDTSDDNDTAAAAGNGSAWEGEALDDGGGLFGGEDEAVVSLEPSSELEANAEPPLGTTACVFNVYVMLLSTKRDEKSPFLKLIVFTYLVPVSVRVAGFVVCLNFTCWFRLFRFCVLYVFCLKNVDNEIERLLLLTDRLNWWS
jgi:hypothetical protein